MGGAKTPRLVSYVVCGTVVLHFSLCGLVAAGWAGVLFMRCVMSDKTIGELLFSGMTGCGNHGCVVVEPVGAAPNGPCGCLARMDRVNLHILQGRIAAIKGFRLCDCWVPDKD